MKVTILLLLGLLTTPTIGQVVLSENFDSMAVGSTVSVNAPLHWRTWNDMPGSIQDAPVTDSASHSPNNSLAFIQQYPGDQIGPVDQLLLLGDRVSGSFVLSWSMYVVAGHGAVIILYHGSDFPSADPAAVLWFQPYASDSVTCYVAGMLYERTFPVNTWFKVSLGVDLDINLATLLVNGELACSWDFATMSSGEGSSNLLSAIRFAASSGTWFGGNGKYYVDDVVFQEGTVGIHEQQAGTTEPLQIMPNQSVGETVLSVGTPLYKAQLEIHDASGRMALHAAWPMGASSFTLEAGALAPGTYLVRVASTHSAASGSSASALGAAGSVVRDPAGGYVGRLMVMP